MKKYFKSPFIRHVGLLASGTIIAQIISVGISPILTRLYTPDDYAALAIFTAIASSLAPGIAGRYDLALVVTKDKQDSQTLLVLAFWIAISLCVLLFVTLVLGCHEIQALFNAGALDSWLLFTPLALFLTALVTILRNYANSQKDYHLLSRLSILQVLLTATFSITLGWLGLGMDGLITASVLGGFFASIYLIYRYRPTLLAMTWRWHPRIGVLAIRYRDYPLFNAPTSFLDGILLSLPVFFLTKYFPEAVVGYYALLTRVASAPLGFIGGAVSQVNLKKMADIIHSGANASAYLRKITLVMTAIALLPTIIFMSFGPTLFAFVFGEPWRIAGELLVILMPSIALRFVVSPLSGALLSTGHVRLGSVWQIVAFAVTLSMFLLVAPQATMQEMFIAILITDLLIYTMYYFFIFYAVNNPKIALPLKR